MPSNMCAVASWDAVLAAVARFETAQAALAAMSLQALSPQDTLGVLDRLETVARRHPVIECQALHQMTSQVGPTEWGATTWRKCSRCGCGSSRARPPPGWRPPPISGRGAR